VIRRAAPADVDALVALRVALRREERSSLRESPERIRQLTLRQLRGGSQVFFLAESDGDVVGILRCALQPQATIDSEGPRAALLTTAYVAPAYRRRRIMRRLVEAAEQWSAERGVRELRLRNAHRNAAANATWEALGFPVSQVVRCRPLPE
jgi:ribosomal protein S18 acetylase RimI-like enzyme